MEEFKKALEITWFISVLMLLGAIWAPQWAFKLLTGREVEEAIKKLQ